MKRQFANKLLLILLLLLPTKSLAEKIRMTYVDCDSVSRFFIVEERFIKNNFDHGGLSNHDLDSRYLYQDTDEYTGECIIPPRKITWHYAGHYVRIRVDGKIWIMDLNVRDLRKIIIKPLGKVIKPFEERLEVHIKTTKKGGMHIIKKLPIDIEHTIDNPGKIHYKEIFVKE